jgi:hypothetical protein
MSIVFRPQVALARRQRSVGPDLAAVYDVVAPSIRAAVEAASREFTRLGVRHVLCGGLAVGAYGHPRATKDVDFLVGDEAFEHHGALVTLRVPFQVGRVAVDSVSVPEAAPFLERELESPLLSTGLPLISLGGLIAMKLLAARRQDLADVVNLAKAGADMVAARSYLKERAPELLERFDSLVAEADQED